MISSPIAARAVRAALIGLILLASASTEARRRKRPRRVPRPGVTMRVPRPPSPLPPPEPAPPTTPDIDPDREAARRHFEEGRAFFSAGNYERALVSFDMARRSMPLPELDYNMARCYDVLGQFAKAIGFYQRFLDAVPADPDALDVRQRIDVLRGRIAVAALEKQSTGLLGAPGVTPKSAETPSVDPPAGPGVTAAPPSGSAAPRWLAPGLTGGIGAAMLITGGALLGSVKPDYDRLLESCNGSCSPVEVDGLRDRQRAGYALIGIGAAAVAASGVLFYVAYRKTGAPPAAVVAPGAGGVSLAGRF